MSVCLVGWKNGSESLGMLAGGEPGGVTLISEEKAGCNVFDKSKASSLLKCLDHLLSNSANLVSVESEVFLALESDESEDFLTFAGSLSFLSFFSGGTEEEAGDLSTAAWPTTPITETLAGSTSSDGSLVGVADFLASRFSFFNLYDGVEI